MDNRYMKSYSTLPIKEMQITNNMRFYLTSFRRQETTTVYKDIEKRKNFVNQWDVCWLRHFGKQYWVSQKIKNITTT